MNNILFGSVKANNPMKNEFGKCTHCAAVGNTPNLLKRNICGSFKCEAKRTRQIKDYEKNLKYN